MKAKILKRHKRAQELSSEFVIAAEGVVVPRSPETINPDLATGDIEVAVSKIWILNESRTPPFPLEDNVDVKEDVRLKYRYIDLRRPRMQRNIVMRSKISFAVREALYEQGFLEIETPFMTRSTPEGARDYLVPSRVQPGNFYALPQSPQIFKQLLMVSGYERYFQIVRCFRDEDLRADRQPEFTQIDMEMSFPHEDQIFDVVEHLIRRVCAAADKAVPKDIPRMTYDEAMRSYGSDKPDLRIPPFHCVRGPLRKYRPDNKRFASSRDSYPQHGPIEPQRARRNQSLRPGAWTQSVRRHQTFAAGFP